MEKVSQKQLGERFAQLRKNAGYTQVKAAEKLGVNDETISRLEQGKNWTTFKVLENMARLYQVTFADLMAIHPETELNNQATIQEIVDMLRPCQSKEVKLARDLVATLVRGLGK